MTLDNAELPPPPPPRSKKNEQADKASRGITCAKCTHVNKPTATKCTRCGSHLHVKCNDCGARNERVYSRCQICGRRLHKTVFEKMNRRIFTQGNKISLGQVTLLVLLTGFVIFIFWALNNLDVPKF